MHSIRQRLLVLILSIFFLICSLIAAFFWWRSSNEVDQLFDEQLVLIADLIAVITQHERVENNQFNLSFDLHRYGFQFPIVFQAWSGEGQLLLHSPDAPRLPLTHADSDGFSDARINHQHWRIYTQSFPAGEQTHIIHVARTHSLHEHLVKEFLLNILKPVALLLLPFIGLLWLAINGGLAPLHELAKEISDRDHSNLEPLTPRDVPKEVTVMVNEINALFLRLKRAVERFSRFTSDVSHELRNPIAGIITHTHIALNSPEQAQKRQSLKLVVKGSHQLAHIVDQLLTLARIEPDQLRDSFVRVNLHAVAVEVIAESTPKAIEKGLDIELQGEDPVYILGNKELAAILLSNLIRNSIHATPAGGLISVRLEESYEGVSMQVTDTGPGIPEAERKRIFERFYQLPGSSGSGLGLSIVQAIASVHTGRVSLAPREGGSGLVVRVQFPPLPEEY
jgi:two-component system sensor histidine kinase QseC